MKKVLVGVGVLILVGVIVFTVVQQNRNLDNLDERVVYIRSVERIGLHYIATVDDVASTLETPILDTSNARVFESLDQVPVSFFSVTTLANGKRLPVFRLASWLKSEPAYTNVVFTIKLKNGKIIDVIEETLE